MKPDVLKALDNSAEDFGVQTDYSELSKAGKIITLDNAVLSASPEEVRKLYAELGEVEITGFLLVNAYRYRGMDMLKVLVESGADFAFNGFSDFKIRDELWTQIGYDPKFILGLLNVNGIKGCYRMRYVEGENDVTVRRNEGKVSVAHSRGNGITTSREERDEMLDYLFENKERVKADFGELLFYAYLARDEITVERLKKHNVTFSEKRKGVLTGAFGRSVPAEWWEYTEMMRHIPDDSLISVMSKVSEEAGGSLHFTEAIYESNFYRFLKPDILEFFLDKFNNSKMNKSKIMKRAIDSDKPELLEMAVKRDWIKTPKKRDEMIQYAVDNNKTECTAFLLDYKNRTADLTAERIKAEKKMEQELNADPNSVAELKKIWSFEKLEDGTVEITGYKGKRLEVIVPEKIGKAAVTAIGENAFWKYAPRLRREIGNIREKITKITLPDTINRIGANAFRDCEALQSVNIPHGVTEICDTTFCGCRNLSELDIPDTVKKLGIGVFQGCNSLKKLVIPECETEFIGMFAGCSSLEEVVIPKNAVIIGNMCFQNCKALKKVTIPEGVTEIGKYAFAYCPALEIVELPGSVKSIKNYKNGYKYAEDKSIKTVFQDSDNVTAVVPEGSYAEKYCKRNDIKFMYKEEC